MHHIISSATFTSSKAIIEPAPFTQSSRECPHCTANLGRRREGKGVVGLHYYLCRVQRVCGEGRRASLFFATAAPAGLFCSRPQSRRSTVAAHIWSPPSSVRLRNDMVPLAPMVATPSSHTDAVLAPGAWAYGFRISFPSYTYYLSTRYLRR